MVERNLPKVDAEGSSPFARSSTARIMLDDTYLLPACGGFAPVLEVVDSASDPVNPQADVEGLSADTRARRTLSKR